MKRNVFLVLLSTLLLIVLGFSLSRLTVWAQEPEEDDLFSPEAAPASAEPELTEDEPFAVSTPEPTPEPTSEPEPEQPKTWTVTEYKSEDSERFLWDCLSRYSPSDVITASILAMFWRESFLRSDATAHWSETQFVSGSDYAAEFTAEIDSGLADGSTREQFAETVYYVVGGYGLGQWYSYEMLIALYDYAQAWGTSVADAEMQCAFTLENLQTHEYEELWAQLLKCRNPYQGGWLIARLYDGTRFGAEGIAHTADYLYSKYSRDAQADLASEDAEGDAA